MIKIKTLETVIVHYLAEVDSRFFRWARMSLAFDLPSWTTLEMESSSWISVRLPPLLVISPKVVTWWPSKQCMNCKVEQDDDGIQA